MIILYLAEIPWPGFKMGDAPPITPAQCCELGGKFPAGALGGLPPSLHLYRDRTYRIPIARKSVAGSLRNTEKQSQIIFFKSPVKVSSVSSRGLFLSELL